MRNDYGSNVVALEELPLKRWLDKGDENWDGYITDHLQIGGDFRLQSVQYNDNSDNTRKSAIFPMQAEVYAYLKLNKNAGIFAKLGIPRRGGDINEEYWVLFNNLPRKSWLKIGRTLPNYGLRVDDHTSFIRGGNISKTLIGLNSGVEGLIFTPSVHLSPPVILEMGAPVFGNLQLTTSISTSLLSRNNENLNNLTTQLMHTGSMGNNIKYRGGISYMYEDNLIMAGASGGVTYGDFTWTFEGDQTENWIEGNTSWAFYDEIAWEFIQGLQIIGKYDFFEPNTNLQDGAISRYTLGAEIYPLNIMEIKLQVRFNKIEPDNTVQEKDPEYLIQTHFFF